MNEKILQFLNSNDPLSDEALKYIINYKEEDQNIDYKLNFDYSSERDWLEITKDFLAFSNSSGGYLIFGIKDKSHEIIGLDDDTCKVLTDTNLIRQKLNRYIDPSIDSIRSKQYIVEEKKLVVIFIPESKTIIHVISKDGTFKYPSGERKTLLFKGSVYVRKSAGNKIAGSREFDELFNKHLEVFKQSLLSKITKVVESPTNTEVFIVAQDKTGDDTKKFIIEDGPDAIPVKGLSFTTAPRTYEQEIASWKSMNERDPLAIPPEEKLWKFYTEREKIQINETLKLAIVKFSIICHVPYFYWLRDTSNSNIKDMIIQGLHELKPGSNTIGFFKLAPFLGKNYFEKIINNFPKHAERLSSTKFFPGLNLKSNFNSSTLEPVIKSYKTCNKEIINSKLLKELNSICLDISKTNLGKPSPYKSSLIIGIDCELYSQNDKYTPRSTRVSKKK